MGFPDSSVDKESSCNAGDPSLITESGRSTGEAIGYLLQYSSLDFPGGASGKEPACQGSGLYPEEGMATHFSILAWRIPWAEEPARLQSMESQRVRHD